MLSRASLHSSKSNWNFQWICVCFHRLNPIADRQSKQKIEVKIWFSAQPHTVKFATYEVYVISAFVRTKKKKICTESGPNVTASLIMQKNHFLINWKSIRAWFSIESLLIAVFSRSFQSKSRLAFCWQEQQVQHQLPPQPLPLLPHQAPTTISTFVQCVRNYLVLFAWDSFQKNGAFTSEILIKSKK